ncbi:iron complex transport system ATP-binding protein [Psychrobacter sp. PL19]|uniref:Fe(3+) dicitrate ABC transporter ATP-binding protein FecE n=1 Tax=Psychrobacter sp. PL19 TaxID=2760711 RepID=UPI001AEA3467
MLSVNKLQLGYHGGQTVIKNLSLELPENKVVGLIGPNGCGKSTLLKGLCRLIQPQSGKILLRKQDMVHLSGRQIARQISVLPQAQTNPEGLTVRQLVEYGRTPYVSHWGKLSAVDQQIVDRVMNEMSIQSLAETSLEALSGGQQQRAWLAMVLAQDTDIIMLDEPTTYLDISYQIELMKLIRGLKEQGKSLIVVLHDLNQAARYCDLLVVLKSGELKAMGTPEEIMTEAMLAEIFEVQAKVITDPIAGSPMCIYL